MRDAHGLRRQLSCPLCGGKVSVPASAAVGRRACCEVCGGFFRIPSRRVEDVAIAALLAETPLVGVPANRAVRDDALAEPSDPRNVMAALRNVRARYGR
ncbi:MAG: hypothetical protein KC635_20180 [Myxococcales bacterium]|nr:hypothetical protein [Myxococcales bacterium]MCB9735069.1 hypothetical protein [Deltaproteobacteria bacterium]